MNVHVTNLYGFSPNSVTLLSQIEVRNIEASSTSVGKH